MRKVKIKDNEAVGPYEYITLDNLEDFMIQSSGRVALSLIAKTIIDLIDEIQGAIDGVS